MQLFCTLHTSKENEFLKEWDNETGLFERNVEHEFKFLFGQ